MIEKFSEIVTKDFDECSRGFRGSKYGFILWNFAYFDHILLLNCYKTMEKKKQVLSNSSETCSTLLLLN